MANAVNAVSVVLATRNSAHTWWTGIIGAALFGVLFYSAQLYANSTLQVFFIGTSLAGWWHWLRGDKGAPKPVTHAAPSLLAMAAAAAVAVTAGYGALLKYFTDAYAPFINSGVLACSVVAQLLLMTRRYEAWWFWLLVNTLAVPLFLSRGLWITAALYAAFWVNAVVALYLWRRLVVRA